MQVNSKVAVLVCLDPLFGTAKASGNHSASNRSAGETATDVSQLRRELLVMGRMPRVRLPVHTTNEEDFGL
jgi:hypothetical protein